MDLCIFSFIWFLLEFHSLLAEPNVDWDINSRCQEYIKALGASQVEMINCAVENSIPPSVCTNCIRDYINFRQMEYRINHLDHVFSEDNKTCTSVIYNNYVLAYNKELSIAVTNRIWDASKCDSCLVFHWDLPHENSSVIKVDEKTGKFYELLVTWRDCVENISGPSMHQVCNNCTKQFQALFDHYWAIYTEPGTDFCLDVEATFNDTLHLWENVWGCQDDPHTDGRNQDIRIVAFSATLLLILIGLFYAGSYIQSEQSQANLIQYSRLQQPRGGPRSRLLSSSTLDSSFVQESTPSSSQHG